MPPATRPPLSYQDAIRALAELAPEDDEARLAILATLGFQLSTIADATQPSGSPPEQPPPAVPDAPAAPAAHPRERGFTLRKQRNRTPRARSVLAVPRVKELDAGPPEDTLPRPPHESLLRPSWSRGIVSTLARRLATTGRPDVARLITAAARPEALSRLPVQRAETANGADVLVDVGEGMQLFARDQQRLLAEARHALGNHQVAVFRFIGSPVRGVTTQREREPIPYRPPVPGWPVIVLTDLGIGAPPTQQPTLDEWCDLARMVRAVGSRLIALVPYPRARWPTGIGAAMHIIHWDRPTTIQSVRATLGRIAR